VRSANRGERVLAPRLSGARGNDVERGDMRESPGEFDRLAVAPHALFFEFLNAAALDCKVPNNRQVA
jgi:hypothetical protein